MFYKKWGFLLGGCLNVKNQRGLLTGDDVVGFRWLYFSQKVWELLNLKYLIGTSVESTNSFITKIHKRIDSFSF